MLPTQNYSERSLDGVSFKGATASFRDANFARAKLRGADFEEADLSMADFSSANLCGANFKGAKLCGANFTAARMGLSPHAAVWLVLLTLGLMFLAVGMTIGAGAPFAASIFMYGKLGIVCSSLVFAGALTVSIIKGVEKGLVVSFLFVPLVVAAVYLLNYFLSSSLTLSLAATMVAVTVSALAPVMLIFLATANVMILTVMRAVFGEHGPSIFVIVAICAVLGIYSTVFIASKFGLAPGTPVPVEAERFIITTRSLSWLREAEVPEATLERLKGIEGRGFTSQEAFLSAVRDKIGEEETWKYGGRIVQSARNAIYSPSSIGYPAFLGGFLASLAVLISSVYLAKRTFEKEAKQSLILNLAVACLSKFGTSFEEADVKDANFTGVDLRNTNFKYALNAKSCEWFGSKDEQFSRDLARLRAKAQG